MANPKLRAEVDKAIDAHSAWKLKLKTAIRSGKLDQSPADVYRDDLCAFGKWLNSDALDDTIRAGMPYKVVKRLHGEFHQAAGSVLSHVARSELDQAQQVMDRQFLDKSQTLVMALTKWQGELGA